MKKILNLFKNSKVKMIIILSFLLFLYITICAFSYAQSVLPDIADSVFRLHVIANSDSEEDQALKYKVRDALIEYMNSLCANISSKEDAINISKAHTQDFKAIAESVISENGYSYPVNVEIGNFSFPTKIYGDVSLPSGMYDALRVKIGSASGQNWWCVMFPPLCFVDVSSGIVPDESKNTLKDSMNNEDYNLITSSDEDSDMHFKFKLVELFENLKMQLAQN